MQRVTFALPNLGDVHHSQKSFKKRRQKVHFSTASSYPAAISPSGRLPGEAYKDMCLRQRTDPYSPGGMYVPEHMTTREHLFLNRGKRSIFCTGKPKKLYNRRDLVGPIIDSMVLMYHRLGWTTVAMDDDDEFDFSYVQTPARSIDTSAQLHTFGYGPAPTKQPKPLCSSCNTFDQSDFTLTADKSHLVCKCGVVSTAIHISQAREKNCAKEDDKTTHADDLYRSSTDRFDHPAKTCEEARKERERKHHGSRISKKTREKMGIGWQQEHMAREAARAERQRNEMDPRDHTKGQRIVVELEKLFTPLEPVAEPVKRYCRMEADRAWREAVRHTKICCAKGVCQLRVKDRGHSIIADAALACALQRLLNGDVVIDGVTHASVLVLADKLGALQKNRGMPAPLRSVRTAVSALLSNQSEDAIPSCPVVQPVAEPSPRAASLPSSDAVLPRQGGAPFLRTDSSASDVAEGEGGELLQLRDGIHKVFRHLGASMPTRIRDTAIRAIQAHEFRYALDKTRANAAEKIASLSSEGLAYVLLQAVAQVTGLSTNSPRSVPQRVLASFSSDPASLDECIAKLRTFLPTTSLVFVAADQDCLFG